MTHVIRAQHYMRRSSLKDHVAAILFSRANEQMIRIYAAWVIAAMADVHLRRNNVTGKLSAHTMGKKQLSFMPTARNSTIACAAYGASPEPARAPIAFFDFGPKPVR